MEEEDFNIDEDFEPDYMIGLKIEDVYLLYHSVKETIRIYQVLLHALLKNKNISKN